MLTFRNCVNRFVEMGWGNRDGVLLTPSWELIMSIYATFDI